MIRPVVRNSCGRIFYRHRWGAWLADSRLLHVAAQERRCARCGHVQFRAEPE